MRSEIKRLCDRGNLREALECVLSIEPGSDFSKIDGLELVACQVLCLSDKESRNTFLAEIVARLLWLGDTEKAIKYLLKIDDFPIIERFSEIIELTIRSHQDEQFVFIT